MKVNYPLNTRLYTEMVLALRYAGLSPYCLEPDLAKALYKYHQITKALLNGFLNQGMKNVQGIDHIGKVTLVQSELADIIAIPELFAPLGVSLRTSIIPYIEENVRAMNTQNEGEIIEQLTQRARTFTSLKPLVEAALKPIYAHALHHRYFSYMYAGDAVSNGGQPFQFVLKGSDFEATNFMGDYFPNVTYSTMEYSAVSGFGVLYDQLGTVKKVPYSGKVDPNPAFASAVLNEYRLRKLRALIE